MASAQRRRRKRSVAAASTSLEEDYTTRRSRFDTGSTNISSDRPRNSEASPQYDFRISTRRISRENSSVQTNSRKRRRSTRTTSNIHDSNHSSTTNSSSSRLEPINRLDELFELNPSDADISSDNDVVITDTVRESPAILDDIFSIDPVGVVTSSMPHPPGHEQLPVTVNVRGGSNSGVGDEVIIVDSEEEEDQDVMVTRETSLDQDEMIARRLQAQYDQERRFRTETFGTAVSSRRLVSSERTSGTGNEIIRDNMDALATRVDNWTTADARRFLMLTIPPTVRGGRRFGHHTIERQLVDTNPMLLYAAIMGGGSAIPSGVSSMGSYEDLLELAEQLGPGRPTGIPDTTINSLDTRQYSSNDSSSSDPSSQSCVICMDNFELSQCVKTLAPCQHDFHSTCIDRWLKNHKTCPICRCEVRLPSISVP